MNFSWRENSAAGMGGNAELTRMELLLGTLQRLDSWIDDQHEHVRKVREHLEYMIPRTEECRYDLLNIQEPQHSKID